MPPLTLNQPLLGRIVNHLIINAGFMNNVGLYHGKMGVLLFFAHYARYTGNDIYEEYAGDLMDDIYASITNHTSWDFETGLAGIGWGINYLLKNGFMEGDPDEVLEVIDQKMTEINLPNLQNISLESGLQGICCYLETRMTGAIDKKKELPFNESYQFDYTSIRNRFKPMNDREILISVIGDLPAGDMITDWKFGLSRGCAGWGMNSLMNNDSSTFLNKCI